MTLLPDEFGGEPLPPESFFSDEELPVEEPAEASPEAMRLAEWAGAGPRSSGRSRAARPSRPSSGFMAAAMASVADDVERMRESGDWGAATARHFVALYEALHLEVYGAAAPDSETARGRQNAAFAAGKVLREEMGGDPAEMAAFMVWAWEREVGRERWRRENNRPGGRLGWRLLFGGVAGDYRVERLRRGGR